MKKTLVLTIVLFLLFSLSACSESEPIIVNMENSDELSNTVIGTGSLIEIGGGLWYDSTTRVVYWWNGFLGGTNYSATPSPYYAPNGLPYRYNPETNTFETIDCNCQD